MRPSERTTNQIRPVTFTRNYTLHAEGSVLVEFGNTKVLYCNSRACVPRFMKGQGRLDNRRVRHVTRPTTLVIIASQGANKVGAQWKFSVLLHAQYAQR